MPFDDGRSPASPRSSQICGGAIVLSLAVITVVTRLFAASLWWSDAETDPDAYVGIARAIAMGDGFCTPGTKQPTAYRPPLYPQLLTVALVEEPERNIGRWICFVNALCGVLLCVVLCGLSGCLPSKICSLAATTLIALDPLLIRATPLAMTEPLFTLLTAVALSMLFARETTWHSRNCLFPASSPSMTVESRPEGEGRRFCWLTSVAAGVFLGLAALCRPTIWPFIGLYSFGQLAVHRRQVRNVMPSLAAMWLAMVIVVSPWVIRNQFVFGRPILTTTHGGYTLLLGNNPVFYDEVARKPWGTVWDGASLDRWQQAMLAEMDAELGPHVGEVAWDRWQAAKAWQYIQDDPAGFGWAVWYRVRSLWSLSPRGKGGESLPGGVKWAVAAWYAGLFGWALAGAVIWARERRPGLWVLLLFIASIQMMHLVYWTDTRMRAPLHPVLALLAAAAIERIWSRIRQR